MIPSLARGPRNTPLKSICHFLCTNNLFAPSCTRFKFSFADPPPDKNGIIIPEKPKLRILAKVPTMPVSIRPPKMAKNLHFMRGPEEIHNELLYKQFGIVALGGGRLRFGHLEMIRMTIGRKMNTSRMFAIWRIDDPWQPVSKRGLGKRHGGGKGSIDHYVTPIKQGRIIIEVGGQCVWEEVWPMLNHITTILPFKAKPVSEKILLADKKLEELKNQRNINPYTYKYLIMNGMCGSRDWASQIDQKYFGKYV